MENLTRLMVLIDANSEKLSEGDYLDMCNTIKSVHDHVQKENVVSSEGYTELVNDLHETILMIEKISDKLRKIKMIQRLSPQMKTQAIECYADVMGLHSLREYTEQAILTQTSSDPREIYDWYRRTRNERETCRRAYLTGVMGDAEAERNRIISELSLLF